jgi:glycosyltransferase involved in cell wall biosynthesis
MPEIFGRVGGIQTYSAFVLEALKQLRFSCSVFLKHDLSYPSGFCAPPNFSYHFSGAWPASIRTQAFASKVLGMGAWQRPHLIIATHLNFAAAAYWLKKLTGAPYWVVAHGVEAWGIERTDLRRALLHADRLLAVSSYTRKRLIDEHEISPHKISLLPDTFNPQAFKILPKPAYLLNRYGLQPDQSIVLTVARLAAREQYKGYDKIINALPRVRRELPRVHYLIVGEGDDRARIENVVGQLDLRDSVTFAGFVPAAELSDHYNLCDVFAMPSKGEGFGIVYLEALACGKPVLAGNRDGSVDALLNGELGALIDPDDPEEIANSLISILRGAYPHELMYKPEALRQKVSESYGFDRFADSLSRYLQEFFASTDLTF